MSAIQGTVEWRIERAGCATSSRFSDVLAKGKGITRAKYQLQLVTERLTGIPVETYQNATMRRGNDVEPDGRRAFETATGILAIEAPFRRHAAVAFCGASPDGEIDDDGLLELKCPDSMTHVEYLQGKRLPPEYRAQVQGALWVTGRKYCVFASFDPRMPERLQLFTVRVLRDDEYIAALAIEVKTFLTEVEQAQAALERYAA